MSRHLIVRRRTSYLRNMDLARNNRPKPDDITQVCFSIDTRTYNVVRIYGKRNGSYSLGEGSYGNPHNNPLEAEVQLIHSYIEELICIPIDLFNTPTAKDIEDRLKEKAAKMKAKGER
jgi:hypothetical protein